MGTAMVWVTSEQFSILVYFLLTQVQVNSLQMHQTTNLC